jgi:hypothetical protein
MSFSTFSSFLQKFAFQRFKSQLKSLPFVPDFGFTAFQLKKPAEKRNKHDLTMAGAFLTGSNCSGRPCCCNAINQKREQKLSQRLVVSCFHESRM